MTSEGERAAIRRTILILASAGFASALTTRFVDPLIGEIARDVSADPLKVALLSTAYALPYALVQPVLGPVGDAFGKERLMKFLLAGLTVALMVASVAPNLQILFASRVLSGAFAGALVPMSIATIGDRVELGERQVAISRFLTAAISGQLLGGVGAGLLAASIGWRGVFALAGLVSLAACVAVALGFRRAQASRERFSVAVAVQRYRFVLGNPRAVALAGFVFSEGVLIFGIQPYIAPLLEQSGQGGAWEAGLILGGFAAGGILYTLLVRWLLRVFGLRRTLQGAGIMVAVALGALAPVLPWPVEVAAMVLVGGGFYALHNSFQTQMTEVVPQARASALSLHAFGFFVGQALGPVVVGVLLGSVGRAPAVAICSAGVLAMGFLAAWMFGGSRTPPV